MEQGAPFKGAHAFYIIIIIIKSHVHMYILIVRTCKPERMRIIFIFVDQRARLTCETRCARARDVREIDAATRRQRLPMQCSAHIDHATRCGRAHIAGPILCVSVQHLTNRRYRAATIVLRVVSVMRTDSMRLQCFL